MRDEGVDFWDINPLRPIFLHIIAKVFHLSSPELGEFGKLVWDNEIPLCGFANDLAQLLYGCTIRLHCVLGELT